MCEKIIVAILLACLMLSLVGCDSPEWQETCTCDHCNDNRWDDDDRYYDYEPWDRL